jgi:hypothetical protein
VVFDLLAHAALSQRRRALLADGAFVRRRHTRNCRAFFVGHVVFAVPAPAALS